MGVQSKFVVCVSNNVFVTVDNDGAGRQNHSLRSFILAPNPATSYAQTLAASASGQIGLRMKKQIQISGTYKSDNKTDSFTGTVTFDERENSIYYSWALFDKEGKSIAGKSLNVAFQQVPAGQDRFEFTKAHAIEGIKEFRIGREKIVYELSVG